MIFDNNIIYTDRNMNFQNVDPILINSKYLISLNVNTFYKLMVSF